MLREFCKSSEMLDDMIKTVWYVCGINDGKIQQRLLSNSTLTFTKTTQQAQAAELAKQGTAEVNKDICESPHAPAMETSGVNHPVMWNPYGANVVGDRRYPWLEVA